MAEREKGTVESYEKVCEPLKRFGIRARVWDEILDELFDEPLGNIPGPLGFLLADVEGKIGPQRLDYSRPDGITDRDYVRELPRRSIEELSSDPNLPDDDGSDCDEANKEYEAYCASLN